jgi:hypothetical protein
LVADGEGGVADGEGGVADDEGAVADDEGGVADDEGADGAAGLGPPAVPAGAPPRVNTTARTPKLIASSAMSAAAHTGNFARGGTGRESIKPGMA